MGGFDNISNLFCLYKNESNNCKSWGTNREEGGVQNSMIWNVSEWKVYTIDLKQEFLRVINHDQTISKKEKQICLKFLLLVSCGHLLLVWSAVSDYCRLWFCLDLCNGEIIFSVHEWLSIGFVTDMFYGIQLSVAYSYYVCLKEFRMCKNRNILFYLAKLYSVLYPQFILQA